MLTQMPGVSDVQIEAGNADIVVTFDPALTDVKSVLEGLQEGGQPAREKS